MLQKFLFVGLGGSGGKTLRYLYEDLERRLRSQKWDGPMPSAWQFLHIDVPTNADGVSPDLPSQLSQRSYVGLAPTGMTYSVLDELLEQQGNDVRHQVASWRPRADRVGINPTIGAGQFRAVGRAITAASLSRVVDAVRNAINELTDINNDEELSRLSLLLTGDSSVSHDNEPQVVLVTSITGGSGAGSFLDAADVLRHSVDHWGGESVALLYLPDVFDDIPDAARTGIAPNALAAISEMMNAHWSGGELVGSTELALLQRAGLVIERMGRRGPRYPLLVGRANGVVRFDSQNEVYRVTAKAVASWVTSEFVQDQMKSYALGNWQNASSGREDHTGLTDGDGLEVMFGSIGFGSVGLGRDRFAQYARERLAAHAVDHLLRGHHTEEVRQEVISADDAAEERAAAVRFQFMDRCELRELGPTDNQVLDAIRGGERQTARQEGVDRLRRLLRESIAPPGATVADIASLRKVVPARNAEHGAAVVGELFEEDAARARSWVDNVQRLVLRETSHLLGREGAHVTEAVLRSVQSELATAVVPELRRDEASAQAYAAGNDQRVAARLSGGKGKVNLQDPAVSDALRECVQSAAATAEARLHDLTARLLIDLVSNLLDPLRAAVANARRGLEIEDQGTPEKPSEIKRWTRREVPRILEPAQNETLLQEVGGYPEVFENRLRVTTGEEDAGSARARAVRDIIAGVDPSEDSPEPDVITVRRRWIPKEIELSLSEPPTKAGLEVRLAGRDLMQRALTWVRAPGRPLDDYISESLTRWLHDEDVPPQVRAERLNRFKVGLQQAVAAARPLIEMDRERIPRVHPDHREAFVQVISPIPFPKGHPGRDVVLEVFNARSADEVARMFGEGEASAIEITSVPSQNALPQAIASIGDAIGKDWKAKSSQVGNGGFWDWRRARPLHEFIPAPPHMILQMLRGWHVARLLDWIEIEDPNTEPVSIWTPTGPEQFPFPLLRPKVERKHLLSALLESMALTLVCSPAGAMPAYWQLAALGSSTYVERPEGGERSRKALENLLVHGVTLPGAPAADLANLATADERIDYTRGSLARYRERYEKEGAGTPSPMDVALTWEISHLLLDAVDDLDEQVVGLANADVSKRTVW